jgi:hypothetical protein
MSGIEVEYRRRWDGQIRSVTWRIDGRAICQANRRVGEEDLYIFFGTKLTPEAPRVCRSNITLERCTSEVIEHIERAKRYGYSTERSSHVH